MNPYERTSQAIKKQSEGPKGFGKAALGAASAAGAASFAPILARAAPFLSKYIPEEQAIKGLSKISPQFGKFIAGALGAGYNFNETKDFIGEQINDSKETSSEPAKESRNIIEQYSPELFSFINEQVNGRGLDPLQAGAIAQNEPKFSQIIKKISEDHKSPWSNILQSVFGNNQAQGQTQPNTNNAQPAQQQSGGLDPELAQLLQQGNGAIQKYKGLSG